MTGIVLLLVVVLALLHSLSSLSADASTAGIATGAIGEVQEVQEETPRGVLSVDSLSLAKIVPHHALDVVLLVSERARAGEQATGM
jgi:hypothetical protein